MNVDRPVACIIGAGPAGLALGLLLQRACISFVLLERQDAAGLRARTKAGMIEHRTVELLRAHDLAGPILARGSRIGTCEFRADGEPFTLDYAALCGGHGHHIYPQQELVGDWAEQLLAGGGDICFGVEAAAVEQSEKGAVVRAVAATGDPLSVECEVVACCDGAGSAFAPGEDDVSVSHPLRWLTLIAAVPPSSRGTIYGLHPRGFAGQMHRSRTLTRFMLEVPRTDAPADWPDDRIWPELQRRLAASGRPQVEQGELVERDVLDHRVRVCARMQDGRIFAAGDAAHLITPAGGKGMNMAIQDAVELALGISDRYGPTKTPERLARYSETRLPSIWRQQEFSNLMLSLFNGADSGFSYGLRRARLDLVVGDRYFSHWFARAYAGVDD